MRCDEPIPGEDLTWVLYGSGGCSLFDTAKLARWAASAKLSIRLMWKISISAIAPGSAAGPPSSAPARRWSTGTAPPLPAYYTPQRTGCVRGAQLSAVPDSRHRLPCPVPSLWLEAIRRLQLKAMDGKRRPRSSVFAEFRRSAPRPPRAAGPLSETEILALGSGDIAVFPGRARRRKRTR